MSMPPRNFILTFIWNCWGSWTANREYPHLKCAALQLIHCTKSWCGNSKLCHTSCPYRRSCTRWLTYVKSSSQFHISLKIFRRDNISIWTPLLSSKYVEINHINALYVLMQVSSSSEVICRNSLFSLPNSSYFCVLNVSCTYLLPMNFKSNVSAWLTQWRSLFCHQSLSAKSRFLGID